MNSLKNQVKLIGYVGKDPEIKTFGNSRTFAKFSIATHERRKDKNGEVVEKTEWHQIIAWGKMAETMQQFLKKGKGVAVQGKISYNTYQDKQGVTRNSTTIVAHDYLLLGAPVEN